MRPIWPMHEQVGVIVAHADDELLGCGGTIARLADRGVCINLLVLADGETARKDLDQHQQKILIEKRKDACRKVASFLGIENCFFLDLPDNRLDSVDLLDITQAIEAFLFKHRPSLVITQHSSDLNLDHEITSRAVLTAARPVGGHHVCELIAFETPSSTEWAFSAAPGFRPDCFVDVSTSFDQKIAGLKYYAAEMREAPHPRSTSSLKALGKWRGAQSGFQFAEAFETVFRFF
jgi:LmbE family N-acetylglucosaminyl deacetylase